MLAEVAAKLDAWIIQQNMEACAAGLRQIRPCRIQVLGQAALLESKARLHLNVTNDVDVYADYEHAVQAEFGRLLAAEGKRLDPVGHEVWMPKETRYADLFVGEYVTMQVADIDAVLLSKALKAPRKNYAVLVEYLAKGATERFLKLAKRYGVDLEQFL